MLRLYYNYAIETNFKTIMTKRERNPVAITPFLEKDSLMFIIILGLWIMTILHFDPKIIHYLPRNSTLLPKISILIFLVCVDVFWLYGIYHLVIAFFSAFVVKANNIINKEQGNSDRTAILYLTMNDFREEAVLSCLNQDSDNFNVFILDDSDDRYCREKVDSFITRNNQVRLIRRKARTYFKAGNLNNALSEIYKDYDYFAVSDSDGILPDNFLKTLLPYFKLDKNIGFVQANQRWNPNQESEFAKDLGLNTDVHWKYYLPAKNIYGFLMFYGHGAIIRTDIWKEIGGFPHSITEDLVFSSLVRGKGYIGVFVPEVICLEDYPEDYKSFRIRNERWVKGTTEYLFKWFPKLLLSSKVPWFEKLDVFVSAGILLQPFVFIIFLLIVSVVLPFAAKCFGLYIPLVATFVPLSTAWSTFFAGVYFSSNWTFDFFLMMTIAAFAQFAPLFWSMLKDPIRITRHISCFMFICLSSSIASFINICSIIISRKSNFLVTGIRKKKDTLEHKIIVFVEMIFSVFLVFSTLKTGNVWLVTVPFSVILNPFMYKIKWDNPIFVVVTYLPFVLISMIVILISISTF
ncbi:MAG: glycosyltransferase family 2 protein [Candidatus Margulisbacteria bacterium]|nr:glycosyltransferase family 2 protein [Candidatus Margulisiibacteriota bacterium]